MNYEELYNSMQNQEKILKDKLAQMQKLSKSISKEMAAGDLKSLAKDVTTLMEANQQQAAALQELSDSVEGFDSKAYFESGEFAGQMLAYCQEMSVDVQGEYPVYEMFPYRVRFDTENQDIYLDRKRVQCMRPQSFVQTVKASQEKLRKASFNEQLFLNELAEAYDLAILKMKKAPEADIYLMNLYKFLTPMGRFRKEYDLQNFAFDVARLYASDVEMTKNGRHYQFGTSRKSNKSLRILDAEGREWFMATIRFYND